MKTYLEYQDDKSHKFWQIETAENNFTVTYGKAGTNGRSQTKTFADNDTAQKEAKKLIEQKKKKGYAEKGADMNTAQKTEIDPKKRQNRIKKLFKKQSSIVGATITSKERMGFITHAWGTRNQGAEECEVLVILYDANVLPPKGTGFIANRFTGVRRGSPELSQDGTNSIVGLFQQGSYKGSVNEFVNNMHNHEVIRTEIPLPHYTMWATATIDGEIYFAGTPRVLYKRLAPGKWKNLTERKKHPQMFICLLYTSPSPRD